MGSNPPVQTNGPASGGVAMRAQAATEVLVLAGFTLAFILPLAFLFLSASNSEISKSSISQAKASSRAIADTAGEVYLQGSGAKKTILVHYPEGVMNVSVEGGLVVMRLSTERGPVDVAALTFADAKGDMSGRKGAGLHRVLIENRPDDDGLEEVWVSYDES